MCRVPIGHLLVQRMKAVKGEEEEEEEEVV